MKSNFICGKSYTSRGDNSLGLFRPDVMAKEILFQMEQGAILLNMVHRDYENNIQSYGDSVSVRKPSKLRAYRKGPTDSVTKQDIGAEKVNVPLDQHLHVSFPIADEDYSKSEVDLLGIYSPIAAQALLRSAERAIAARMINFKYVGSLNTAPTDQTLAYAGTLLDNAGVNAVDRIAILTPAQYQAFLNVSRFSENDKINDGGLALQKAFLGERMGFRTFKTANMPSMAPTYATTSTTTTAAIAAGATVVPVTSASGIVVGGWITVGTDGQPLLVTGVSSLNITVARPIRTAQTTAAAVKIFTVGAVNNSAGYLAAYRKDIAFDGLTTIPADRCGLTIGANATPYLVLEGNSTALMLDRPLDVSVANDAVLGVMPNAEYGFCGDPHSVAFVNRPLALIPNQNMAVVSAPNARLSVRVGLTYSGDSQQILFTADMLCGTQVLTTDAGITLLS